MSMHRDYSAQRALWPPLTVTILLFVLTTAAFVLLMMK